MTKVECRCDLHNPTFSRGVVHLWLPAPKLTCARSLLVKILMLAEGQNGHMCLTAPTTYNKWQRGVEWEERREEEERAPIHSRYVQHQTLGWRWPRLEHQTTSPKSPSFPQKTNGSSESPKNGSDYTDTENNCIFPACCLKLLSFSLPSCKYARNFNKEGKNKKIDSI